MELLLSGLMLKVPWVSRMISGNPIVIVIPCHRVLGYDGKLTGYAGGLDIKERLLALEKRR